MKEWFLGTVSQDAKKAPIGLKWCSMCAETKPLSEFHHINRKIKSGKIIRKPHSECKDCANNRRRK